MRESVREELGTLAFFVGEQAGLGAPLQVEDAARRILAGFPPQK